MEVLRDRNGSFQPQMVQKRQRRLAGFDEQVIALYSGGLTQRDIRAHLEDLNDVSVSPDLISRVIDAVVEELQQWQKRPLGPVCPVVFLDAIWVRIRDEGLVRNKAVYLSLGIRSDGTKEVLGLWVEHHEGAKFWLRDERAAQPGSARHPGRGGGRAEGNSASDPERIFRDPGATLHRA